jgi:hypothetical protein
MPPSEVLAIVAQVAVTLAGFAAIVVVFRPGGLHEWSPLERFRLRLLLINSTMPLVLALLGLLLLTIEPAVPGICVGIACRGMNSSVFEDGKVKSGWPRPSNFS